MIRRLCLPLMTIAILFLGGCGGAGADEPCSEAAALIEDAIMEDVSYLASPELDGRVPGTAGDVAARQYIADRFSSLGLTPFADSEGYEQPFTDGSGRQTANVLGYLPGSDTSLAADVILISAHHDHLGDGLLGANDNASGVSGLMAIAQELIAGGAPARTVVFATFGSEESGFEGSEYFMTHLPSEIGASDIVYNINLDMIGSYSESGVLYALGTLKGTLGNTVVSDTMGDYPCLEVNLGDYSDESDNISFCERGIPYIFFWTEDNACYHDACDTADRIDSESLAEIALLISEVALGLASSTQDLRAAVDSGSNVCAQP